jgi:hypothetical protein
VAAAGLLVRNQGELGFIPASMVRAIRYDFVVTPYPGSQLGMTLFAGRVIPVLDMGSDDRAVIVCEVNGELVGVRGLEPIQSGVFDGDEHGAVYESAPVPTVRIEEHLEYWRAR